MLKDYMMYFVIKFNTGEGVREEGGFYPSNTFSEGVGYLEKIYGDDLVSIEHLEILDTSFITMKPEQAEKILEYNFG